MHLIFPWISEQGITYALFHTNRKVQQIHHHQVLLILAQRHFEIIKLQSKQYFTKQTQNPGITEVKRGKDLKRKRMNALNTQPVACSLSVKRLPSISMFSAGDLVSKESVYCVGGNAKY